MSNKIQKIATYVVFILLGIWGISRLIVGYVSNQNQWTTEDKLQFKETCIEDLQGRAVRYAEETDEYCSCFSETITTKFSKTEYLYIKTQSEKEQNEAFLPMLVDCYNDYQKAMFEGSR